MVGTEFRHALNQHFQFHHAQRGVIKDHGLHRQIVATYRQQLAHQHCQAAITRETDDLAVAVCLLHANSLWQCVGHGAVLPGTNHAVTASGVDIPSRPHVAHSGIDGDHGVVVQQLIDLIGEELRVDRGVLFYILGVRLHDMRQLALVFLQHVIQERAVSLFLRLFQQRVDGG